MYLETLVHFFLIKSALLLNSLFFLKTLLHANGLSSFVLVNL
jgi:hypothetical protein